MDDQGRTWPLQTDQRRSSREVNGADEQRPEKFEVTMKPDEEDPDRFHITSISPRPHQ